jgi:hypothetical protein
MESKEKSGAEIETKASRYHRDHISKVLSLSPMDADQFLFVVVCYLGSTQ